MRYGARGTCSVREATNGIDCNNRVFGDPLRGVRKACFVESLGGGGSRVTLRSHHGKYVVAESDGRADANRDRVGAWAPFRLSGGGLRVSAGGSTPH